MNQIATNIKHNRTETDKLQEGTVLHFRINVSIFGLVSVYISRGVKSSNPVFIQKQGILQRIIKLKTDRCEQWKKSINLTKISEGNFMI